MSAWLELIESYHKFREDGTKDFGEWLDLCSRAMVEVQTEQRRRDAKKIRSQAEDLETFEGMRQAADLIDPDK